MWGYLTVVRLDQQFWGCLTRCESASLPVRLHHPLWCCHTHYYSVWQLQGHLIKVSGETASQLWGCLSRCEAEFIVVMLPHQLWGYLTVSRLPLLLSGSLICCKTVSHLWGVLISCEAATPVVRLPHPLQECFAAVRLLHWMWGYLINCEATSTFKAASHICNLINWNSLHSAQIMMVPHSTPYGSGGMPPVPPRFFMSASCIKWHQVTSSGIKLHQEASSGTKR